MLRKAAEAVYSEIIDSHWLRTNGRLSSKDGLYIGETYVTVIHSVRMASAASSDDHKPRGVLTTSDQVLRFYQHMLPAPWSTKLTNTDLYLVSHTNPYVTSAIFKNYRHRRGPFTQEHFLR